MRVLFGDGVQSFATGPDGGRDARFHGTAAKFPVQPRLGRYCRRPGKTYNAINAHFADSDFVVLQKVLYYQRNARIRRLVAAGEINNYILFSNRRLGPVTAIHFFFFLGSEFRALLHTAVDILRSGVRAIGAVRGGPRTEQRMRAERLRDAGFAQVLLEAELHADSLASAVAAASRPLPPAPSIMLDGASRSVAIADEPQLSRASLSRSRSTGHRFATPSIGRAMAGRSRSCGGVTTTRSRIRRRLTACCGSPNGSTRVLRSRPSAARRRRTSGSPAR